jgi:hypothetical protein
MAIRQSQSVTFSIIELACYQPNIELKTSLLARGLAVSVELFNLVSMQSEAVLESPSTVLVRMRMSGLTNQKRSTLFMVS